MPDNVGVNRQLNRQQRALLASAGSCPNPRYSIGFSGVTELKGIETRPLNYFRPNSQSPRKVCAGFYSNLLGKT
jgi:hypothetical protein